MYRIWHKIQLYWACDYCAAIHKWPQERAKRYCNRKCRDAHYYSGKRK